MQRDQLLTTYYMVKSASKDVLPKQRLEMGQAQGMLDFFDEKRRKENIRKAQKERRQLASKLKGLF